MKLGLEISVTDELKHTFKFYVISLNLKANWRVKPYN